MAVPRSPELAAWPRRPARLATAVIDTLLDEIVVGRWPEGSVLPTESELCQTFGVSRPVLREAVKTLESMRLLMVRQGQGTSVRLLDQADLLNPLVLAALVRHDEELAILDDVVDVRRALESQMAGRAAERLTEDHREEVARCMAALDDAIDADAEDFLRCDVAFHDAIHAASGNRLGRAAIHTLTQEAYRSMRYVRPPEPRERYRTNAEHRSVYEAVMAGDERAATQRMNDHIVQAWVRRRPTRDDLGAPFR